MPKVLHISKFYPPVKGGIETVAQILCKELQPYADIEVLAANTTNFRQDDIIDSIPVHRAGTLFRFLNMPICPAMPAMIRELKPDLVHLHWPNPAALLALLQSKYDGPSVVTYHADLLRLYPFSLVLAPVVHRFLERSAAIFVSSENYVRSSPFLPRHEHKCRIAPFGIYTERFHAVRAEEIAAIRAQHKTPILLAVCRLSHYKGLTHLFRAMRGVDATLLVIGNGPQRKRLEGEIRRHKLENKIRLLGEVGDIVPYYQACDIFVLPSVNRGEAFGVVQLEAMACAKPVINTSIPSGVPFVSPHMVTGLTVPPEDSSALCRAINTLLTDTELSSRLGQAGLERINNFFTIENMIAPVLRSYREVLGLSSNKTVTADSASLGSSALPPIC